MQKKILGAVLVALMILGACVRPQGPVRGQTSPFDRGTTGVGLLLRHLDGVKRVLVIGAHPDDEDTSLIAELSRGLGARVAYLSLSRGEGGQNLIGDELDEGLGLLRSGELLAARSLDGGVQYFTRAFDFGYSKTAEETLGFWPREKILADVTWVVRTFRPQVVVSVFSGTDRDGHGQHQMAGMMAREAFRAAADPSAFPDQLEAGAVLWAPSKLFRLSRFGPGDITTSLETGGFDPLLGRSPYQLAMEARSQHRSQDMGRPEPMGPRSSRLSLLESCVDTDGTDSGIFAGVDTTLIGLAEESDGVQRGDLEGPLERYRDALSRARSELDAMAPWNITPILQDALTALRQAQAQAGSSDDSELERVLDYRVPQVEKAVLRSAGVTVDVRLLDDLIVPGESVTAEVEIWNGGPYILADPMVELELPPGWSLSSEEPAEIDEAMGGIPPGQVAQWRYSISLSQEAELSRPYFLEEERDGEIYRWPKDHDLWAKPGNPPLVHGVVRATLLDGPAVALRQQAVFRGVDKAVGEYTEPPLVVPALSVSMDPASQVWPLNLTGSREFTVRVRNQSNRGRGGTVFLNLPPGWMSEPSSHRFSFHEPGAEASFSFSVTPPESRSAGVLEVGAVARTEDGEDFQEGVSLVDYPHIRRTALFSPALARVSVFPVEVRPGLRVGYIMGSGDMGPEVLGQIGVAVEMLNSETVLSGDFGRFDALVLGIRVYETRPDVVAANDQILAFARNGGTLLVQYNKYEFPAGEFAPYPVEMNRPHDRVADETAPVRILDPDHPVFNQPNRITQADFTGWAQERGLYFLSRWDRRYTPLLEMADPGEDPKRGGLLVAPLGEGLYVYTGVAFFRQFPEGVAGAVRLFANLVSLRREDLNGR